MQCDTWPVPEPGECQGGCTIPADTDPALIESASEQAGIILRYLSGQTIGTCEDTIRPLGECPVCGRAPCCGAGDRVHLTHAIGPVTAVFGVTIDGAPVVDWTFYPDTGLLYRVPPEQWPERDKKWADCGQEGSFCVDVQIGHPPDVWALAVHAELTCELLKSCAGGKNCRIPSNATRVTGQGVTVELSATELAGFIPNVGRWANTMNPHKAVMPAKFVSPDVVSSARSGGGCGCG